MSLLRTSFLMTALLSAFAPAARADAGVVTTADVLSFAKTLEASDGDPEKVPEYLQKWRESAVPRNEIVDGNEPGVQRFKPGCQPDEGRCAETEPRHCRISYWGMTVNKGQGATKTADFQTGCGTCLDGVISNGAHEAQRGVLRGDLGVRCEGEVTPRRQPASTSFKVETLPQSPCHREPEYFSIKKCEGNHI